MIHPPKHISSLDGLGLGTVKTLQLVDNSTGITTEVWPELDSPWKQGETVIAESGYVWKTRWQAGKPYVITKFFDSSQKFIGVYCDISRPVKAIEGGFEFVDLYLDVWFQAGKEPLLLDEDELEEAVKVGLVSTDETIMAQLSARYLLDNLKHDSELLDF